MLIWSVILENICIKYLESYKRRKREGIRRNLLSNLYHRTSRKCRYTDSTILIPNNDDLLLMPKR